MKLSYVIDKLADLPMLPLAMTENNERKSVRVAGICCYVIWFLPAAFIWIVIVGLLAVPAMIQDA